MSLDVKARKDDRDVGTIRIQVVFKPQTGDHLASEYR